MGAYEHFFLAQEDSRVMQYFNACTFTKFKDPVLIKEEILRNIFKEKLLRATYVKRFGTYFYKHHAEGSKELKNIVEKMNLV